MPESNDAPRSMPLDWPALVRQPFVTEQTGYSKAQIYGLMSIGKFPQAVRVGMRGTAWYATEVWEHIQSRPRVVLKGKAVR